MSYSTATFPTAPYSVTTYPVEIYSTLVYENVPSRFLQSHTLPVWIFRVPSKDIQHQTVMQRLQYGNTVQYSTTTCLVGIYNAILYHNISSSQLPCHSLPQRTQFGICSVTLPKSTEYIYRAIFYHKVPSKDLQYLSISQRSQLRPIAPYSITQSLVEIYSQILYRNVPSRYLLSTTTSAVWIFSHILYNVPLWINSALLYRKFPSRDLHIHSLPSRPQ